MSETRQEIGNDLSPHPGTSELSYTPGKKERKWRERRRKKEGARTKKLIALGKKLTAEKGGVRKVFFPPQERVHQIER